MVYTPDFVVFGMPVLNTETGGDVPSQLKFIEVKGAHIWAKDLVRFKGCRAEWPMFEFEMHQKKGGQWQRIH